MHSHPFRRAMTEFPQGGGKGEKREAGTQASSHDGGSGKWQKGKGDGKKGRGGLRRAVAQMYHVYAWVVKNGHHNHHHCGRGVITTAVAAPVVTITISRLPAKTYVIAGFQPSLQARKFRFTLVIGVTAG